MTTKTDAARVCAYEQCAKSIWGRIATSFGQSPISWPPAWIEEELRRHFPPSVPVSKLKTLEPFTTRFIAEQYDRFHLGAQNGWVRLSDVEALIAEAK